MAAPPEAALYQLIVAVVLEEVAVNVAAWLVQIVGFETASVGVDTVPVEPAPPTVAPFGGNVEAMVLWFPDTIPLAPPATLLDGMVPVTAI
jgi:hypothetical protein